MVACCGGCLPPPTHYSTALLVGSIIHSLWHPVKQFHLQLPHCSTADCLPACLCRLPLKMQARWQYSRRGAAISSGIVATLKHNLHCRRNWKVNANWEWKGFPFRLPSLRVEAPFIHVTCLLSFWFLARLFICFQTDCIIITQLFWVL